MPDEEKKRSKFKAVTEEVGLPEKAPEILVKDEKKGSHDPSFIVKETNNITSSDFKQSKGVFLKFFLITFFATLLAMLLAGGIYVYLTGTKGISIKTDSGVSTPLPTSTPSPTATATPKVDFSTYKFSVLNGNGGIGVAGAAKAIIEKVGFKVSNLGNADNFTFTDTMIQAKASVASDAIDSLKTALSDKYSVKIGTNLDSSNPYDIIVTVGSK